MEKIKSFIPWHVGGILDWYIIRGFLKIVLISLVCTTVLYLIVDFFEKIESLLKAGASLWTSTRYFAYKLPLMLSRVFGFAVLFSALFSIGMLSRNQEITAMRAGGISVFRISQPLFACALVISALNFFWNETVAPIFAREAQYIYKTEVKKREPKSVIGTKDMWLRTEEAFVNVSYFDRRKTVLEGVSIFLLNRDFTLRGLIEAPAATWNGSHWEVKNGSEWVFLPDGTMLQRKADTVLAIAETPEDLKLLARDPEEFGFFDLRRQVADLSDKGIDTTEQRVDLQAKMAVPFIPLLMVLLAIPFAVRHGRSGGLAISFGLTMLIGFGYWFLRAFSLSLGHSGALPGWIAAWIPNITMTMVALYFYANSEES